MKLFSVKDVWQCQNYATAIFLPVEAFRGTHKTRLIRMLPIFQILTKKKTAIVQVFGLPVIISSFPIFCHHSHLSVSPFFIVMGSWFLSKFLKEREMQIFLLGRMTGLFPLKERRRAQLPRIFWYFFLSSKASIGKCRTGYLQVYQNLRVGQISDSKRRVVSESLTDYFLTTEKPSPGKALFCILLKDVSFWLFWVFKL